MYGPNGLAKWIITSIVLQKQNMFVECMPKFSTYFSSSKILYTKSSWMHMVDSCPISVYAMNFYYNEKKIIYNWNKEAVCLFPALLPFLSFFTRPFAVSLLCSLLCTLFSTLAIFVNFISKHLILNHSFQVLVTILYLCFNYFNFKWFAVYVFTFFTLFT
jgi:hypothetical protein